MPYTGALDGRQEEEGLPEGSCGVAWPYISHLHIHVSWLRSIKLRVRNLGDKASLAAAEITDQGIGRQEADTLHVKPNPPHPYTVPLTLAHAGGAAARLQDRATVPYVV